MPYSLAFILSEGADAFTNTSPSWSELIELQHKGMSKGFALRIFRCPTSSSHSLESLVEDGLATAQGLDPFLNYQSDDDEHDAPSSSRRRLCDAVIPQYIPAQLWLGVYELCFPSIPGEAGWPPNPQTIQSIQLLDHFPLSKAENETCWFYPTETGTYLAWENQLRLQSLPGFLPELPSLPRPIDFARADIRLLWALMADDECLTCVGLTYQRRRIDWPFTRITADLSSTWSSFMVDSIADPSFQRLSTITTTGTVDF